MTPRQKKLREETLAAREILATAFPRAFAGKGMQKRPLKIGIRLDIQERGIDLKKAVLYRALFDYTHGPLYLKAMVAGAPRYDLDGNEEGVVTEDEAAHAAKRLRAINSAKARRERSKGKATKIRRQSERDLERSAA